MMQFGEKKLPSFFKISSEVAQALAYRRPVLALESTVITHGLPYPHNLELARDMEVEARNHGVTPATIAVVEGKVYIGVSSTQLEYLASTPGLSKISSRDFGPAVALARSGGTTVAGTLLAAHQAGIQVFATGGIGGVHRQAPFDISADLPQLARTPLIVVCAGAKAILDLPATLEYLETAGVPVVGYGSNDFPAFYSRSSGLKVTVRADTPQEVVDIARAHWEMGMQSALLVVAPPPEDVALPAEKVEKAVQIALKDAAAQGVHGQQVTPFLLGRLAEISHGESLRSNLGLLCNNARIAADIAHWLAGYQTGRLA